MISKAEIDELRRRCGDAEERAYKAERELSQMRAQVERARGLADATQRDDSYKAGFVAGYAEHEAEVSVLIEQLAGERDSALEQRDRIRADLNERRAAQATIEAMRTELERGRRGLSPEREENIRQCWTPNGTSDGTVSGDAVAELLAELDAVRRVFVVRCTELFEQIEPLRAERDTALAQLEQLRAELGEAQLGMSAARNLVRMLDRRHEARFAEGEAYARAKLLPEIDALRATNELLTDELEAAKRELDEAREILDGFSDEFGIPRGYTLSRGELRRLCDDTKRLHAERDEARATIEQLRAERDAALAQRDRAHDCAAQRHTAELDAARAALATLVNALDQDALSWLCAIAAARELVASWGMQVER